MHHTRLFVSSFLTLATFYGCAAVEPSSTEEDSATADGDGGQAPTMDEDTENGSGGAVVLMGSSSGGSSTNMGGATSGGSSSGGSGPRPLASCDEDTDCNDQNACTDDSCNATGQCAYVDNGTCECTELTAATDCDDENPCTDDTCSENTCVYTNNTAACDDDGDACTQNVCEAGACTHPAGGICSATTVTLRSVRDGEAGQYVTVDSVSALVWDVTDIAGEAAVFDRVEVTASTFKLLHVESGMYVVLGVEDAVQATGTEEEAAIFETTDCPLDTNPGVGLSVTTDDDGGNFWAAEPGGEIKARSGGCNAASGTAWERFEMTPTGS